MGLNVDNIFIKAGNRDQIVSALPSVLPKAKWKVAVSTSTDGWFQLIDSHGTTPPDVAQKLSEALSCLVICIQIYETSGDAVWSVFDHGNPVESLTTEDTESVIAKLQKHVGAVTPLLFRDVIKNPDWQIEQTR